MVDLVSADSGPERSWSHPEQLPGRGEGGPLGRVVREFFDGHPHGSFTQLGRVTGVSRHVVIVSEELLSNFPGRITYFAVHQMGYRSRDLSQD